MKCDLSMKTITCKKPSRRKDCERICFVFVFACVVGKNQSPQIEPHAMAGDAITCGGIGGLGSLVYICGLVTMSMIDFYTSNFGLPVGYVIVPSIVEGQIINPNCSTA